MKRKITVFVLCFSLIVSCCMIGSSAKYFTDVSSTSEYLDAINYVSDNGYMGGTSSTEFSPTGNMNRATFATVLYRYATDKSIDENIPFTLTDVATTAWYYDAVHWAHNNGYMGGTSATTFSPTASITRQDAATVLYRYAGMPDSDGAPLMGSWITDCDNLPDYARPAVLWAAAEKVMSLNVRHFRPTSILSRQEMAEAVVNYGVKVKGIDVNTEGFGFANDIEDIFGEDETDFRYNISNSLMNTLIAKLKNSSDDNKAAISLVLDIKQSLWSGSCFGMAATCGLDKMGKIDFNTSFSGLELCTNMNDVDFPKDNDDVAGGINYYSFLQVLPSVISRQYSHGDIKNLSDDFFTDKMFILGMCSDGENDYQEHAVLVYDVEKYNDNYICYAYDPNYPGNITTYLLNANDGEVIGGEGIYYSFTIFDNWNSFDEFDLDGTYNSISNSYSGSEISTALMQSESTDVNTGDNLLDEYDMLYFSCDSDMIIENDDGAQLVYSNGNVYGNISVFDTYLSYIGSNGANKLSLCLKVLAIAIILIALSLY